MTQCCMRQDCPSVLLCMMHSNNNNNNNDNNNNNNNNNSNNNNNNNNIAAFARDTANEFHSFTVGLHNCLNLDRGGKYTTPLEPT